MSNTIPPVPQDKLEEGYRWREFFTKIQLVLSPGASGSFTSQDGKTITVVNGIITGIN